MALGASLLSRQTDRLELAAPMTDEPLSTQPLPPSAATGENTSPTCCKVATLAFNRDVAVSMFCKCVA